MRPRPAGGAIRFRVIRAGGRNDSETRASDCYDVQLETGIGTMSVRTMVKKLTRLEALARRREERNTAVLEALAGDPARLLADAGLEPDPWQQAVLRSDASRLLLLASRQAGKSSVA